MHRMIFEENSLPRITPLFPYYTGEVVHLIVLVSTLRTLAVGGKGSFVGMAVLSDPVRSGMPVQVNSVLVRLSGVFFGDVSGARLRRSQEGGTVYPTIELVTTT